MSHGSGGGSEGVEVNLIPMIDIVIQLITFFLMLVNFDETNIDERVRLPIADLAKPSEMEIEELLVLNVDREGLVNVGIGGDTLLEVGGDAFRQHLAKEARAAAREMKRCGKPVKFVADRPLLWTTVMIRADQDVEYQRIQRLMKVCQEQGFYKFALRASPEKKRM